jgi:hypothetical protein
MNDVCAGTHKVIEMIELAEKEFVAISKLEWMQIPVQVLRSALIWVRSWRTLCSGRSERSRLCRQEDPRKDLVDDGERVSPRKSFRPGLIVDLSGASMQGVAQDCEWGIYPGLFHVFWLVRRDSGGRGLSGLSSDNVTGVAGDALRRSWRAQLNTKGRRHWAANQEGE